MTPAEQFFWGCGGSAAIEVVNLYREYHTTPLQIPERYKRFGFWVTRMLLTILAGFLAVAHDVDTRLLAINVGASAPLILQVFARGAEQ